MYKINMLESGRTHPRFDRGGKTVASNRRFFATRRHTAPDMVVVGDPYENMRAEGGLRNTHPRVNTAL